MGIHLAIEPPAQLMTKSAPLLLKVHHKDKSLGRQKTSQGYPAPHHEGIVKLLLLELEQVATTPAPDDVVLDIEFPILLDHGQGVSVDKAYPDSVPSHSSPILSKSPPAELNSSLVMDWTHCLYLPLQSETPVMMATFWVLHHFLVEDKTLILADTPGGVLF